MKWIVRFHALPPASLKFGHNCCCSISFYAYYFFILFFLWHKCNIKLKSSPQGWTNPLQHISQNSLRERGPSFLVGHPVWEPLISSFLLQLSPLAVTLFLLLRHPFKISIEVGITWSYSGSFSFGMDNIIYFVIGFKSFDIERISGTSCAWFRWTEWSRKAITRTTCNKTSMEWIVRVLEEATKTQGNTVCWWRKTDGITEVFWTWNYN